MAQSKEKKTENTRISYTASAIEKDFAEHLKYTQDADVFHTTMQGRYDALAYAIRDRIIHQWDISRKTQQAAKAKRVYYLSLEFLMGRAMTNNITNMGLQDEVSQALKDLGYTYEELADVEPDAGLGNGGLGRLAACFLDSMATLEIPSFGTESDTTTESSDSRSRTAISSSSLTTGSETATPGRLQDQT